MSADVLPRQTLCIVYCDIANSTSLLAEAKADSGEGIRSSHLSRHLDQWQKFFLAWGAECCKFRGDGWLATFPAVWQGVQALAAAWEHAADSDTADFRMRASVHWGEVSVRPDREPLGTEANTGARILSAAFGDQLLISDACLETLQPHLPPDWELVSAGRRLARGLPAPLDLSSLRAPGMPLPRQRAKGSLPAAADSFVGRQDELRRLSEMLVRPDHRLITLIGIGGSGKTRLALEAGNLVSADFRDGVFFIPLEEAQTVPAVLTRIAAEMGVRLAPTADPLYVLQTELEHRECLLILDNFEQVAFPALPLLELLKTCPDVSLLVTSRHSLKIRHERWFDVAPLGIPASGADWQAIESAESVRLFVERAQERADWQFELTPDNAPEIAAVCRLLDGLPLALELAAAQLRRRALSDLLVLRSELLDLQSRVHGLPDRQQSLRAAFDWTCDRLDDTDRRLFGTLGLFETPFSAADAEAVCGLRAGSGFDILEDLRDTSLVTLHNAAEPRTYRLLMPVREYARELHGAPTGEVRQRFVGWYTDKAQECFERAFLHSSERDALRRVKADLENFRAAWNMAKADGNRARCADLGVPLTYFAPFLPRSAEIEDWIPTLQAFLLDTHDSSRLCRLFNTQARLAMVRGDALLAVEFQRKVLEHFTQTANLKQVADAQSTMALFAFRAAQWEDARHYAELAVETARLTEHQEAEALSLCILANLCLPDAPEHAERLAQHGLNLYAQAEDRVGKMHALLALGRTAAVRHNLPLAESRFREALREALDMDLLLYQIRCTEALALFYQEQGLTEKAKELLFSVLDAQKLQGIPPSAANALKNAEPVGKPDSLPDALRRLLARPQHFPFDP